MRFSALVLLLLGMFNAVATAREPAPVIAAKEIPAPPTTNATGPSLVTGLDGAVWLTWLEQLSAGITALRLARFEAQTNTWSAAQTIASGQQWFVNYADFPALAVGEQGAAAAVWYENNSAPAGGAAHDHHGPGYRALISQTTDQGKTWSPGEPLTRESDSVEFVSLATLADGRTLAVWLDGRAKKRGGKAQQLFGRVLGSGQPDTLIDGSVCDCCQTALTAFPDGGALVAYRGRGDDETRDIRIARFRGSEWSEPRPLAHDGWQINGCPVNGPQLASDGGRIGAAWFTAADQSPRVLASFSPDAGARFLQPLRLDQQPASGRVDTLLLRDGAMLVSWVDTAGQLWLRRISPGFAAAEALALTAADSGRVKGFPRLALRRDYAGGPTAAEILVAFAVDGPQAGLRTLLVTVPEGALLAAEQNCACAPTPEQLQGYEIRGKITDRLSARSAVRARHSELPGVFEAGTREFRVAPALLEAAAPGREFLGRIERRDGAWWLFDARFVAPATPAP